MTYYIVKEHNLALEDYRVKDSNEKRITYIDKCNKALHLEVYHYPQKAKDRLLPDPSVQPMVLQILYQKRKRYRLDEAQQAQDLLAGLPSEYTNKVILRFKPYRAVRGLDKGMQPVTVNRNLITDSLVAHTPFSTVILDSVTLPMYDDNSKEQRHSKLLQWLNYTVTPHGNYVVIPQRNRYTPRPDIRPTAIAC